MIPYLDRLLTQAGTGILMFKEKHGTRHFLCHTKEDYCRAALKILRERLKEGWYWDDPDDDGMGLTKAGEISNNDDAESAFEFLWNRSDWEYEEIDIVYPEKY